MSEVELVRRGFRPACSLNNFHESEVALIIKYGAWLSALMNGDLPVDNKNRKHFLSVCQGDRDPKSDIERAWSKYLLRLEVEELESTLPRYQSWEAGERWIARGVSLRGKFDVHE